MSVIQAKLDHWINNNFNVCFIGRHGVGKTAMVKAAFDRHGLRWRYFSASTMDPWTDFVGVPKERTENKLPDSFELIKELAKINRSLATSWIVQNWHFSEDKSEQIVTHIIEHKEGATYLDFIRPRFLGGDERGVCIPNEEIEALFFDEYNRSTKKIRNSVMELIQFKSVNGYRFPKLRVVWIAINPDDEEQIHYDVEQMDEAQSDRFQVRVKIPYRPDVEWFRQQYGQRMADSAISWWDELDDDNKRKISPRRLQYALDCAKSKGDLHDILPPSCNVSKLIATLKDGPITDKLEELMRSNNPEQTKKFLQNENNCTAAMKYIVKSEKLMNFFLPHIPKEKIISLMDSDDKICDFVIYNLDKHEIFKAVCKNIKEANQNAKLFRKIRVALTEEQKLSEAFHRDSSESSDKTVKNTPEVHYNKKKSDSAYLLTLENLKNYPLHTETQRMHIFNDIKSEIPQLLSKETATKTLNILSDLFTKIDDIKDEKEKSKWDFTSIVTQPQFAKLIGIINNCLETLKKEKQSNLQQLVDSLDKAKPLFIKLANAGMLSKLIVD